MGYCFGGAATLEMARSDMAAEASGFATFHGGLSTPEGQSWDGDEPPLLVLHGGADTSITLQDVADFASELEAAGNTYTAEIYSGAPHAFTVFGSDRYDARADAASWASLSAFLGERTSD
ncbi:dienelactone hydrolase family protein [Roseovarius sp. S4756]|uniref:dienelactone hydrolase family protein n=1 Tax=Roseovarius maritimus TaxID=3342637 RepID=UPI00372A2A50